MHIFTLEFMLWNKNMNRQCNFFFFFLNAPLSQTAPHALYVDAAWDIFHIGGGGPHSQKIWTFSFASTSDQCSLVSPWAIFKQQTSLRG